MAFIWRASAARSTILYGFPGVASAPQGAGCPRGGGDGGRASSPRALLGCLAHRAGKEQRSPVWQLSARCAEQKQRSDAGGGVFNGGVPRGSELREAVGAVLRRRLRKNGFCPNKRSQRARFLREPRAIWRR